MNHTTKLTPDFLLDREMTLADAARIARGEMTVTLSALAAARCTAASARLAQVVRENRHVYGITTGFGPLANRLVNAADGHLLQQNLINHLASGVGPALIWPEARAVVLARLMSVVQGLSGASLKAIGALVTLMNSDLAPLIPSKGTVGASGDLTPLAHMVLCMQGTGRFLRRDGTVIDGATGLQQMGLAPLTLTERDGLALVNGTSAMTGLAVLNAQDCAGAISWSTALTAALAETMNGRIEAWHPAFGTARPHPGQVEVAAELTRRVSGSDFVTFALTANRWLQPTDFTTEAFPGQDAYCLRCAPQVIGAARDVLTWHDQVVQIELQSVTDNPIFPDNADAPALHGGNFMGQHVGLASDALSNAVIVLAGLAERQVARLTDETLNKGLPAFLHRGPAGLNSGFMGAQVTATALLAELRATGGPATIHSLSTNAANQDVVSLGTIAARLLRNRLQTLTQIQAILALCVAQAMDILAERRPRAQFSASARSIHQYVRCLSAPLDKDRPLGEEIEQLAAQLSRDLPPAVVAISE